MSNFINTKNALLLASALTVVGAGSAIAETITGNASVTVQNALTLTEDVALSFGTVVAIADDLAANQTTLTVNADGTTTVGAVAGAARFIEVTAGNRGEFTVSGAAPQTNLTVTLPAAAIVLTDGAAGAVDTKQFDVDTFTKAIITAGGAGFTDTTTDTGTFTFGVGATLSTDTLAGAATLAVPYADVNFVGTYSIEVTY
ncbi:MAG: hypothetical protein KAI28_04450 [Sphingomonadales bacterium]|nr:hypothetical protein [Sphingomonadales bacterium]